jgi:hypothetical protein
VEFRAVVFLHACQATTDRLQINETSRSLDIWALLLFVYLSPYIVWRSTHTERSDQSIHTYTIQVSYRSQVSSLAHGLPAHFTHAEPTGSIARPGIGSTGKSSEMRLVHCAKKKYSTFPPCSVQWELPRCVATRATLMWADNPMGGKEDATQRNTQRPLTPGQQR